MAEYLFCSVNPYLRLSLIHIYSLREEGAGFGVDTNIITLISDQGVEKLPLLSKYDVSRKIWDAMLSMKSHSNS